jgi:steroid 5-alpha reductase family enzyme
MSLLQLFLQGGLAILVYVSVIWIFSLLKKDAGIMDIFWGLGFTIVAYVYLAAEYTAAMQPRLLYLLVLLWGLRLTIHIGVRNLGEIEDARYANWREQFGTRWWWLSYFRVFVLQGVVMWLVSIPLLTGLQDKADLVLVDYLGMLLFVVGFLFESVGDWQLRAFKKNKANKGKVLNTGLWGLTRHPNYFGEALLWWGFALIAVEINTVWILMSPLIMTWLLIKVSGVKMLDELLLKTKPDYAAYIQNTNAFLPGKKK